MKPLESLLKLEKYLIIIIQLCYILPTLIFYESFNGNTIKKLNFSFQRFCLTIVKWRDNFNISAFIENQSKIWATQPFHLLQDHSNKLFKVLFQSILQLKLKLIYLKKLSGFILYFGLVFLFYFLTKIMRTCLAKLFLKIILKNVFQKIIILKKGVLSISVSKK